MECSCLDASFAPKVAYGAGVLPGWAPLIADVNAAGIAIRNAMLIGDTQGMQSELQKVQEARARIEFGARLARAVEPRRRRTEGDRGARRSTLCRAR